MFRGKLFWMLFHLLSNWRIEFRNFYSLSEAFKIVASLQHLDAIDEDPRPPEQHSHPHNPTLQMALESETKLQDDMLALKARMETLISNTAHLMEGMSRVTNIEQAPPHSKPSKDQKWYKIQVDGISTTTFAFDGTGCTHSAENIHKELVSCNPSYATALPHIVAPPRWMRAPAGHTNRRLCLRSTTNQLPFAVLQ